MYNSELQQKINEIITNYQVGKISYQEYRARVDALGGLYAADK